jgi:acetylornithine/N-succinyldiaminopimelate aminotransferase
MTTTPIVDALSERVNSVMMPTYGPLPLLPVRAKGCDVEDSEGRHYLDLAGGIAVNALGHCHPALIAALTEQANKLWHLSNVFTNEPALELAERLIELTFAERVFFANSGAEANEAALKLARRFAHDHFGPDKYEIVALDKAFHGRTLFTVAVGGTPAYAEGFGPKPEGIRHVAPNDIAALEAVVGPNTAAVLMEPIVAEGGIIGLDPAYVRRARELCDEHDALLIFDEVQTGVGRTGTLYAYQGLGVTPDIMSTAKALGGGFPIGAALARADVAASFVKGTHGSTFGGNPLACAVALAVLDEVAKPQLLANVVARGEQLRAGLAAIAADTGLYSEVRGRGLLLGGLLSEPFAGRSKDVQLACVEHGVLTLVAGVDVVRLTPALNITEAEVATGLERMAAARP